MGASWSAQAESTESPAQVAESLRSSCLSSLTPHERRSHALNTKRLSNPQELSAYLGIASFPAHELMALMALKLAFNNSKRYIVVAIGLLTSKLTDEKYPLLVFDALSSGEIGGEPYITFKALRDWLLIVLSAFDWDPYDFTKSEIEPVDASIAQRMLEPLKAPAVRYAQFCSILETYPYLGSGVANIWQRMLLDEQTTIGSTRSPLSTLGMSTLDLARSDLAVLHAAVGPLKTPELLFRCTKHGFSMKVLESNTKYWENGGVLLVVQGAQARVLVHVSETKGCTMVELSPKISVSQGIEVNIRQGRGIVASYLVVDDDLRRGKLLEETTSEGHSDGISREASQLASGSSNWGASWGPDVGIRTREQEAGARSTFVVDDVQVYGFYEDLVEH